MRSLLMSLVLGLGALGFSLGSPAQARADAYQRPAYTSATTVPVHGYRGYGRARGFYPGYGYYRGYSPYSWYGGGYYYPRAYGYSPWGGYYRPYSSFYYGPGYWW